MKKSTFQNIIKEELVKVLKDKSYLKEFKKLTIKEAGDYKDVSDKFKDALDDLPDAKFSKKNIEALIKKFREKRPDAAMAYAREAFGWIGGGKWLKEADVVKEADFKYFRQYLIKLGKELGDKRLVQAAEKASDSKIKAMFKKDKHYAIFKDDEVKKLSGKQLHGKIKYDDRFNEVLSKIKGNSPADKGKRAAVEDDIARAKKRGDSKEVKKLKEAPGSTLNISKADMAKLHKTGELELDGHKIVFNESKAINEVNTEYVGKGGIKKMETYIKRKIGWEFGISDSSFLKKLVKMLIKQSRKELEKKMPDWWNATGEYAKDKTFEPASGRWLTEARGKKVTQAMWKKMDVYQRIDALLTIIEDPDRAEKFIEKKWNQLPNDRNFMTTESALKALKEFRTFYKK